MKVDNMLARLHRVRQVRPNSWVACCPVHEDSTPSLSIKLTEDGKALLYCFGCGAKGPEILSALGLSLDDVQEFINDRYISHRARTDYDAALSGFSREFLFLYMMACQILDGQTPCETDLESMREISMRLYLAATPIDLQVNYDA